MKLITEATFDVKSTLVEGKDKQKNLYIQGIFMQAETKNRNGRRYPAKILEREVKRYINEYVKKNRALGELNHPEGPIVNPANASHKITSLIQEGNNYIGKAQILNTPMGNVVKGLLEGGVQLGVSSRGMGSLKYIDGVNEVQDDFVLSTIDIVHDPSAPSAFVNGIMEGVEWVYENGVLTARDLSDIQKDIERSKNREAAQLEAFQYFLKSLK